MRAMRVPDTTMPRAPSAAPMAASLGLHPLTRAAKHARTNVADAKAKGAGSPSVEKSFLSGIVRANPPA